MNRELFTHSPEETRAAGERLGQVLEAGDVVLLYGELGAGKTAFTQGLARGLDVPAGRRVASPTFALVSEHQGRVMLHHIDLYRLETVRDMEEIGMRDYLDGAGVAVVEWAERLGTLIPDGRIEVRLEILGETERRVQIAAVGKKAEARLARLDAR